MLECSSNNNKNNEKKLKSHISYFMQFDSLRFIIKETKKIQSSWKIFFNGHGSRVGLLIFHIRN